MSDEGPHAMDAAPAFTVAKYGSVIQWTPETGWTRNGIPFEPDPPPISQDLLDLLPEKPSGLFGMIADGSNLAEALDPEELANRILAWEMPPPSIEPYSPITIGSLAQYEERYGPGPLAALADRLDELNASSGVTVAPWWRRLLRSLRFWA